MLGAYSKMREGLLGDWSAPQHGSSFENPKRLKSRSL